jgi:hypothetical protein
MAYGDGNILVWSSRSVVEQGAGSDQCTPLTSRNRGVQEQKIYRSPELHVGN